MNRVFAEQLAPALARQLNGLYLLTGEDPLLLGESQDLIVQTARQQEFDEKFELDINSSTNWNELFERAQSFGLFFSKQILILNLPENLTAAIQQSLRELIALLNDEVLLILKLAKLSKAMEKQAWFVAAGQRASLNVNCQTPNAEQLPRWLNQRAKTMGLQLDEDAAQLLCYSYENNLLALKQTLQLLDLLHPDHKLSFARVNAVVEQSAVFTPYQWVDALLAGKTHRARRILQGLQQEDVQPIILLRSLQRDLMTLLDLARPEQQAGLNEPLPLHKLRENFDRLKVWQNRRPLFSQAMQRLTYAKLYQILQQLADIERQAKHQFDADVWTQLADLSVLMSS